MNWFKVFRKSALSEDFVFSMLPAVVGDAEDFIRASIENCAGFDSHSRSIEMANWTYGVTNASWQWHFEKKGVPLSAAEDALESNATLQSMRFTIRFWANCSISESDSLLRSALVSWPTGRQPLLVQVGGSRFCKWKHDPHDLDAVSSLNLIF